MKPTTKQSGKICVSVLADTAQKTIGIAQNNQALADVVEIRLDKLSKPVPLEIMDRLDTPVLFTNRAKWEGGHWPGDEVSRLAALQSAIDNSADYIDIELNTENDPRQQIMAAAKATKTKTIVSWHNFSVTPSEQALKTILQNQYKTGADIGKIVTLAKTYQDVLRVLDLQVAAADVGFPLIAFCMGQAGVISRIATLELGGFMTYASPDSADQTAPGQLPVSVMANILKGIRNEN